MQRAKQRTVHCVVFVHALDPLFDLFWSHEAHGYVDAADDQHSLFRFYFSRYVRRQSPIAGIDLARLQRTSEGAHHSTGGCGDDVIQG